MPRLLQVCALLVLMLGLRPALGFSLLGPLDAEAWQVPRVGHSLGGDIGDVKNLGEEYRWNQPVITYAYDASFLNYFGSNGVAAIEAAIAVFNSLPDVSTLSTNLDEYPLVAPNGAITTFRDSRRINYSAQALQISDLKSFAMATIAEKLGLAGSERWVWALRARETTETLTNFNVIMRNFDPVTFMPSRYVNGSRYTYQIVDGQDISDAIEFPADPESTLYAFTTVAGLIGGQTIIAPGTFFTYLTRDDIGGLRYIYDRDNVNWEGFAPNSLVASADFSSVTVITNQDLFTFSAFTRDNPPAAVQAAFPDLIITSSRAFPTTDVQVVGLTVTNLREPWDDPFTTNLFVIPILETNLVVRFDYTFANVITNYSTPTTDIFLVDIGFEREPWSTPFNPVYRTNVEVVTVDIPNGAIIIVPTNIGTLNFEGTTASRVTAVTNTIFATNITENGVLRPVEIHEVTFFTNTVFAVFSSAVQPAPTTVLREGVGEITFVRLTNAIFTGTNFLHTNSFTITFITNDFFGPRRVTNVVTRSSAQPDILFAAADIGTAAPLPAPTIIDRSVGFVNNSAINSAVAQGGPGNIFGPTVTTFSKLGPSFYNFILGSTTEATATLFFAWGSFDGSTNPPVVYPKDITLEDVQSLITGGVTP